MSGAPFSWWVAGGWAVDLLAGVQTRTHSDIEIAVLRRDEQAVRAWLIDWELWSASGPGTGLDRLTIGLPLDATVHEIWARRHPTKPWALEVVIEDGDDDEWHYRRDQRVRLPLSAIEHAGAELPVLAPEIVLLYKSKAPRERDDLDLAMLLPRMASGARAWLSNAIDMAHPDSPWLTPPPGLSTAWGGNR